MRLWGTTAASWRILVFVLSWASVLAKDESPDIKATEFSHPLLKLSYFEDSDVILFHDVSEANIYRSEDAGATWDKVGDIPDGHSLMLTMHDYDPERAYVVTEGVEHYKTTDRGKSWQKFSSGSPPNPRRPDLFHFHAGDPDRVIFAGEDCVSIFCDEATIYTTNNFQDEGKLLRGSTSGCWWAKSSDLFATGQEDLDKDRILCIVRDPFSPFNVDNRLFISDNYFQEADGQIQEYEPDLDATHGVQGIVNVAFAKKYLLVATTSLNTDEMSLFVTQDTLKWHRAMFPKAHGHKINQGAYTILEGTDYSIQVDVVADTRPSNPMGVMFTSNSNGTYFVENLEHTNRNSLGNVDFEKIAGIQGIYLVNTVDNYEDAENNANVDKQLVTHITFDDGRTFQEIKAGDDQLHLHSVTHLDNVGRVFSSPAPGLVMGVGNTGKYLKPFGEGSLFVSDNAGASWKKALDGPYKYEFGDQGSILVAVKDTNAADVSEIQYSLNHGEDWHSAPLPDELKIRPLLLTTTQDSTTLKFLLGGISEDESKHYLMAIDFEGLHERTCGDGDLEDWPTRVNGDGEPTCIMGHKQTYQRRKKDADCFIKEEFDDPVPETEDCECTDEDFECDYNFVRKEGECEKAGFIVPPEDACKDAKSDATFQGSSGWRLIPGNTCKRKDGKQKDDPVERKCSDTVDSPGPPATGNVSRTENVFDNTDLNDFENIYLDWGESSSTSEETIIARAVQSEDGGGMLVDGHIYRTTDHGKTWDEILKDDEIKGIYAHKHFKDAIFFTTDSTKVIYSMNHAESFHTFEAPSKPVGDNPFSFHPNQKDWLIWVGEKCEEIGGSEQCYKEASISRDRGDNWKTALRYVRKCEFTGQTAYSFRNPKQIVCLAHESEDTSSGTIIVSSNDFFDEDKQTHETKVKDFATMAEFIVVAAEDEESKGLKALASMDGETYVEAQFPYNFQVDHQNAYTVLDSSTHAVNLFVAIGTEENQRYGSIIKSNSNGTSYVMSAPKVNCNDFYFVDFEKIPGLEGVVLINSVAGTEDKDGKKEKVLQTRISHNDGAQWAYLPPPAEDAEGNSYGCSGSGDENCALHLHHYTERADKKKTFGAPSAVGLIMGYGNVGPSLTSVEEADTFMSTDAGITWKSVKKGAWTWQYGDRGSIVVLVRRSPPKGEAVTTNIVSYTTDGGETWTDYPFHDDEVTVLDMTTMQSGASRNFLLWCKSAKGTIFSVNLDFTGLTDRPCVEPKEGGQESDYELWSPKHPMQDNSCLFGHTSQYLRKKKDAECYNDHRVSILYQMNNCTCTRSDFECDYNFELDNHGQCSLVEGKEPMSAETWCENNPDAVEYWEPTGYRRIPLTTCSGGDEFDKTSKSHACKGKEDEYEKLKGSRGIGGVGLFFAIVMPIAAAAGVGWWVHQNWSSKFGQIRLGEPGGLDMMGGDKPWVKYPVIVVSAVVAVVAALPVVAEAVWRSLFSAYEGLRGGSGGGRFGGRFGSGGGWGGQRRFTTRDSFARGRGDYAAVDDDEGELLGDDSDEDA